MHDYYIKKHITLKKKNPFEAVINFFILLVAIPVVAIAVVSLLFYFLFMWIVTTLTKNKTVKSQEERYHYEIELLSNEYIRIILEEDELDANLSYLNECWMENVYNRETCLYRARTVPYIEQLEGKIICFYLKAEPEGAILQVLINDADSNRDLLDTQLIFLDYNTLQITVIDKLGAYYLYNNTKNVNLILGFNKKEKIRIEIIHS